MVQTRRKKKDEDRKALTKERIYELCCIEIGLTEWEFWSSTPRKTFVMQLQHQRRNTRQWEQTRYLAAMIHNAAPGKRRNKTPREMVPLDIDQQRIQAEQVTVEEALDVIKKWKIPFKVKPDKN